MDGFDLPAEPVRQSRAVAPADIQPLVASKEGASIADPDLAFVPLGIDDEHAGGRDHQMVDVASCGRHPTVMQGDDRTDIGEHLRQPFLALRAPGPCAGRLGVTRDGEKRAAEPLAKALPDPLLAVRAATLELATGRCARGAGIDL